MTDLLNFADKIVVITGAAAGMGAAAATLFADAGAEVHALDVQPGTTANSYTCDIGVEASIDATVAQLPARVDVLVNCAGIPNGGRFSTEQVMAVNWLGLRHLTEQLLPRIPEHGAVVNVASTAGRGWPNHADSLKDLLTVDTWDEGAQWVRDNADLVGDGYSFSKEAVQLYTLHRSLGTIDAGVRMNSICPGVTNTAIADDFRAGVGNEIIDRAIEVAGRMAEPAEMAPTMLFLADSAASGYINGVNLNVDRGTGAAHLLGRF